MITAVNYRPHFYTAGYNPIIWSITSDKANNPTLYDYSYVFDVFVDGERINRIVQRPNPSFAGMIDVSSFVQPYLNIGQFANETGTPTSYPFKLGSDAIAAVKILAGEQYRTSSTGPILVYSGTTDDQGEPSYVLGSQQFTQQPVIVLPASLDWAQQQKTLAATNVNPTDYYGLFGELAPYLLKNDSLILPYTCGGVGLFLSNAPRLVPGGDWRTTVQSPPYNIATSCYAYDRYTLSFLNRNPVYQYSSPSTLQASSPKVAWFTFYDVLNQNIGHYAIGNYQSFGGAPRASCGSNITGYSTSVNEELLSLRCGPKDLEDLGVWGTLGQIPSYYTVQLFANLNIAGDCSYIGSPSVPLSELVTVKIEEDCTSYLYPRVRLCWLNPIGGRDYWDFTMFAEETIQGTNQQYYQPEVDWSATTPVRLTDDTTQNWLKGGIKQYNRTIQNKWTITTNWLLQEEVEFIKNALQSSQTWAYLGKDDFPYTCKITEDSYTVKTIKQVKVYTVTFNIQISTVRSMQNI